jgi:hypothetical protein
VPNPVIEVKGMRAVRRGEDEAFRAPVAGGGAPIPPAILS